MSAYRIRVASENSSANPPNPEPRTSPIAGRSDVCASRNCAADSARSKSEFIITFVAPSRRPAGVCPASDRQDGGATKLKLLLEGSELLFEIPLQLRPLVGIEKFLTH